MKQTKTVDHHFKNTSLQHLTAAYTEREIARVWGPGHCTSCKRRGNNSTKPNESVRCLAHLGSECLGMETWSEQQLGVSDMV